MNILRDICYTHKHKIHLLHKMSLYKWSKDSRSWFNNLFIKHNIQEAFDGGEVTLFCHNIDHSPAGITDNQVLPLLHMFRSMVSYQLYGILKKMCGQLHILFSLYVV